jgi:hypothetical protein
MKAGKYVTPAVNFSGRSAGSFAGRGQGAGRLSIAPVATAHPHRVHRQLFAQAVRHRDLHDGPLHGHGGGIWALAGLFAIPVNDPDSSYEYPEQVRLELAQEDVASYERAAEFLNFNGNDLVCMQHEYGIFGGPAGSHVLALLRKLRMPLVTTLHTVLRDPMPTSAR